MDDLSQYLEHFRARVLQDALSEAMSRYWLRRAEQFAAVGNERCDAIARACRRKAAFLATYPVDVDYDVLTSLKEAS